MIDPDVKARANRRLEEVLEQTGARDPRNFYRERLQKLKTENPAGYEEAVEHYRDVLLPAIAGELEEPLPAWTEYGRRLAELTAPGRTVVIDDTGRAHPYDRSGGPDRLILHLPKARNLPAILVGLPPELSAAQRATYDWLVAGRQTVRPTLSEDTP